MDFGKLPENVLATVNFALPPEPTINKTVLTGSKVDDPHLSIGCPQWGVKEWVGKIYPKGVKSNLQLTEYARHFNSIELNATYYNLYDAATIDSWRLKVNSNDFLFCPKLFKGITHEGALTDKVELTSLFLESIAHFKENLGPVFIQLSESFSPQRKEELFTYLSLLPSDVDFFLEVRHPHWFTLPHFAELLQVLNALHKGIVITDTAGRRDCCHMALTQPKTLIRFVANNLHPTDYTRLDSWITRIKYWLDNGLSSLYFFMHTYKEAFAPELVSYFVEGLNKECGLRLKKPILLQPDLFA